MTNNIINITNIIKIIYNTDYTYDKISGITMRTYVGRLSGGRY